METDVMRIKAFLESLPIDVSAEQSLLDNLCPAEQETILVAGDQQAAPYTLLPWQQQVFTQDDVPGFSVLVEYGDSFSIRAVNAQGETERYWSAADFRRFCAHRFQELRQCVLQLPNEMLQTFRLKYFLMNDRMERLSEAAKGCSGCVLVLAADAGGLSEDYLALTKWLKEERCIAGRVSLLLHQRGPAANRMLKYMVQTALGRNTLGVFSTGHDGALRSAVMDIQQRRADGAQSGVLRACRAGVERKLTAALEGWEEVRKSAELACRKYSDIAQTFQAMCATEKYGISSLLTQQETEDIRKEIKDFFDLLKADLPGMVDEAAEKSPDPKKDLKNLCGDYLENLINQFTIQLVDTVTNNSLIPRMHEHFRSLQKRFQRMIQDAQLEYAQMEAAVETEFLQMVNFNLGDGESTLAKVMPDILTAAVKFGLNVVFPEFGFLIGLYLSEDLNEIFTLLVDKAESKKMYARGLCKIALENLDKMRPMLLAQVEETMIPRLCGILEQEYEKLGGVYYSQLAGKAAQFAAQRQDAQNQIDAHRKALEQLEQVFSGCAAKELN